jgi:hypothetical protein
MAMAVASESASGSRSDRRRRRTDAASRAIGRSQQYAHFRDNVGQREPSTPPTLARLAGGARPLKASAIPSRRALANVLVVGDRIFRLVCGAGALEGAPEGWARMVLSQGEIALLIDDGGLDAISAAAHGLGLVSMPVLRGEATVEAQEQTVIEHAGRMPLVWVADSFSAAVEAWARDRGPMTLLVQSGGGLPETERRRIERFVASLGRQAE